MRIGTIHAPRFLYNSFENFRSILGTRFAFCRISSPDLTINTESNRRGSQMRILLLFLISALVVDVACSRERRALKSTAGIEPDNSRRNVRDRNEATKTAENQSENEADRTISQNIRNVLRTDDSLSTNAKNIKIITNQGMVTLRGPVKNEKEKNAIEAKAKRVTGVKSVDNQLEITAAYGKSSFA